jgi:hypothetical protein
MASATKPDADKTVDFEKVIACLTIPLQRKEVNYNWKSHSSDSDAPTGRRLQRNQSMAMKPQKHAFLILVIMGFLLPCSTMAEQVVMKNGDVISGLVKKIEDGELFIEPDYADEFAVDMAAVESIRSDTYL